MLTAYCLLATHNLWTYDFQLTKSLKTTTFMQVVKCYARIKPAGIRI